MDAVQFRAVAAHAAVQAGQLVNYDETWDQQHTRREVARLKALTDALWQLINDKEPT